MPFSWGNRVKCGWSNNGIESNRLTMFFLSLSGNSDFREEIGKMLSGTLFQLLPCRMRWAGSGNIMASIVYKIGMNNWKGCAKCQPLFRKCEEWKWRVSKKTDILLHCQMLSESFCILIDNNNNSPMIFGDNIQNCWCNEHINTDDGKLQFWQEIFGRLWKSLNKRTIYAE